MMTTIRSFIVEEVSCRGCRVVSTNSGFVAVTDLKIVKNSVSWVSGVDFLAMS